MAYYRGWELVYKILKNEMMSKLLFQQKGTNYEMWVMWKQKIQIVDNHSYSVAKGLIGAAIIGPVGVIAGIDGKNRISYHCTECGQNTGLLTISTERDIDRAIVAGDVSTLDRYRSIWKNIEYPYGMYNEQQTEGGTATTTEIDGNRLPIDEVSEDTPKKKRTINELK